MNLYLKRYDKSKHIEVIELTDTSWLSITKKNSIPLVVNYKTPSQNTFIQKLWSGSSDGSKRIDDYRMKNKFYMDPGKI